MPRFCRWRERLRLYRLNRTLNQAQDQGAVRQQQLDYLQTTGRIDFLLERYWQLLQEQDADKIAAFRQQLSQAEIMAILQQMQIRLQEKTRS